MAQDLENMTDEELAAIAGVSLGQSAPSAPGPRLIAGAPPPKEPGIPSGYRSTPSGGLEPIPGGPADPNAKKPVKTNAELSSDLQRLQDIRDQIKDTLQYVKPNTTEIGAYTGQFGGLSSFLFPEAATLNSRLGQLSGQSTIEFLGELRARSEGNPLAGPISDKDTAMAKQAASNLNQTDPTTELARNLLRYDHSVQNMQRKLRKEEPLSFSQYLKQTAETETAAPKVGEVATEIGAIASKADPALAGTNAKVRSMLKAGVPQNVIVDYLNSVRPGLGDGAIPSLTAVERWKAANPNYRGGFKVDLEKEYYRTSAAQSVFGKTAMSAPGAYAIQAANALTAGNLANLTGNQAEAEATISGLKETRPVSSFLGELTGYGLGAANVAGALRAAGAGVGAAGLGGEALFGAATGASAAGEGNRIKGALAGGTLGVLGSVVGAAAPKIVADIISPKISKEVQLAAKSDIPMSLGTMMGGKYKAFEERLANVIPFFDQQLQGISDEAAKLAQRKVFNEVLQPINKKLPNSVDVGEDAFSHMDELYDKEYGDLYAQMRFSNTPDVSEKIAELQKEVAMRPGVTNDEVAQFGRDLKNAVTGPIKAGKNYLTGEEFGAMMSNLKTAKRAAYQKNAEIGSAYNDLQSILEDGAIASTRSENVGKRYRNLSDSYRKFLIVRDAAKRPTGELGEFTGTNLRAAASKAEGAKAVTSGQADLTNLARMMQVVTPAGATGSTTTRNIAVGALLGGGGVALPQVAGPVAGLTAAAATPFIAAGTRTLNPAMRALVASQRPAAVQGIADFTRRALAPVGAAYGRQTLLAPYQQYQEEEQLRRLAEGR